MSHPDVLREEMCIKLADFAKQIYRDASFREHRSAIFQEFEERCKAQLVEQKDSHQREVSRLQAVVQRLTSQIQEERNVSSKAIK